MNIAQILNPQNSAQRRRSAVIFVVSLGLLALIITLVIVSRATPNVTNRAQTQVRTPDEEALANEDWNPNQALAGQQALPPPNTWSENFGKVLANVTGIDADTHLYPPGKAPAPGSIIPGSNIGEEEIIEEDANGEQLVPQPEAAQPQLTLPKAKPNYNSGSPVDHLLNR